VAIAELNLLLVLERTTMSRPAIDDALTHARDPAGVIHETAARALRAHDSDDYSAARNHLRAVLQACDHLRGAHEALARALEPEPESHDPIANPTAGQGAQVSDGREPRSYTPEAIRKREQRAAVQACYEARLRQLGVRR
jgi:hypothetical protein